MLRAERQLCSDPKLVILINTVWLVVENAKVAAWNSFSNKNPHAFNGDRIIWIVYADPENQLRQISCFKPFPLIPVGY